MHDDAPLAGEAGADEYGGGDARRRANLRLALILASVAAAFFIGFLVKIALLGG